MTELPYGLWRRQAPRSALDSVERKARDADEAWDLRHPEEADRLDAFVGRTVRLRRRMEAFPSPGSEHGQKVYPRGCRFVVRGRIRDGLLADPPGDTGVPLLLKPDWVELVPVPAPVASNRPAPAPPPSRVPVVNTRAGSASEET